MRSRAAKRASSPGIDLDKSLKDLKPPQDVKKQRPSVLAIHQGAGVTKKKNGRKSVLSAKAKRRQEKGMDRAEAVMDKTEIKVQKSKGRARTVQERAKDWNELNKKILAQKAKEEALALEKEKEKENWVDEEGDDVEDMEAEETSPAEAETEAMVTETMDAKTIAESVPLPQPDDEEEL